MRKLLFLASLLVLAFPAAAQAFTFYDWTVTGATPEPSSIVRSGSTLWFTNAGNGTIGRIGLGGVQGAPVALAGGAEPTGLTTGPDGNLYFAEPANGKIGRIALPAGTVTEPITLAGAPS